METQKITKIVNIDLKALLSEEDIDSSVFDKIDADVEKLQVIDQQLSDGLTNTPDILLMANTISTVSRIKLSSNHISKKQFKSPKKSRKLKSENEFDNDSCKCC